MPVLKALDELSDFELSAALRGTAKMQSKWLRNATDPQTYLKERQLIQLVQKQPMLYNCRHSQFRDAEHKHRIWQSIAHQLSLEVCTCKNSWAELRYKYQQHVRRLRIYRREVQRHVKHLVRPVMLHEGELLFLYPHVARQPLLRLKKPAIVDAESPEDQDVTILPTQPAVTIIDLDAEYTDQFEISAAQQHLIEAVRAYPQLYDISHPSYTNYGHRGIIWAAISNELQQQATKLMKKWLQMQIRYEWELMHNVSKSKLRTELGFLDEHLRKNTHTVYKLSMYLSVGWYAPIENFRSIMQLITVLKSLPELAQMVELLDEKPRPARYEMLWQRVAKQLHSSHQCCEVTWLMLRNFYMELAEMRRAGYQLKDKWFFEKSFADFYRHLPARTKRCAQKRGNCSSPTTTIEAISDDDAPPAKRPPAPIVCTLSSTTSAISSSNISTAGWTPRGTTTSASSSATSSTSSSTSNCAHNSKSRKRSNINNTTNSVASHTITSSTSPSSTTSSSNSSMSSSKTRRSGNVANIIITPISASISRSIANISSTTSSSMSTSNICTGSAISCTPSTSTSITSSITNNTCSTTSSYTNSSRALSIAHVTPMVTLPRLLPAPNLGSTPSNPLPLKKLNPAELAVVASALPILKPAPGSVAAASSNTNLVPPPNGLALSKVLPLAKALPKPTPPNLVPLPQPALPSLKLTKEPQLLKPFTPNLMPLPKASMQQFNELPLPKPTPPNVLPEASPQPTTLPASAEPLSKSPPPSNVEPLHTAPPLAHVIKLEFYVDPTAGRQLKIVGDSPPSATVLTMPRVIMFIREVMAIPQLHSKNPSLQPKIEELWPQISKKYNISGELWAVCTNCESLITDLLLHSRHR